jgi:RNA polymerase sigma-70 factor (ECF subfamily)
VQGPAAALADLQKIPRRRTLETYHLFHAVQGSLLHDSGRDAEAATALQRALALVTVPAEREFLERRLALCLPQKNPGRNPHTE